jgi:type I site-specific restriction-modification system R (restriction) subunit
MESYGQIIIGSVIAIVSTSIAWFLNQTESYWADKKERNKKLKSLLSHLLEIYQLMVKADIGRFTDKITSKVFKKLKDESLTAETKKQIKDYYEQLGTTFFNPVLSNDLDKVKAGYEESLKDLSEIDPVRAYWLRGKNEIFERLQMFNQFIEEVKSQSPQEFQQIGPYLDSIINSTKKTLIKEAVNDLEEEIIEISGLVGRKQRKEIIETLIRISGNQDKSIDKMIKDLFSKFEKQMNNG